VKYNNTHRAHCATFLDTLTLGVIVPSGSMTNNAPDLYNRTIGNVFGE
jgi:hypothetical protein